MGHPSIIWTQPMPFKDAEYKTAVAVSYTGPAVTNMYLYRAASANTPAKQAPIGGPTGSYMLPKGKRSYLLRLFVRNCNTSLSCI